MTGRAVATQGALALLALALAYFTWQREPELGASEVMAFDAAKGDLEKVRYEDNDVKSWVELVRDKDANGSFIAVRMSGSDATGVALPAHHPGVPLKIPERQVRGNESADRLFESFAPLRGLRALGVLDAAKLKDLGLDTTKRRIEILARNGKRAFKIAPAPPGGSDPYIQDEQDGRVYVVRRNILSDLQSASVNLLERRLHDFRLEEADRIVMTAGGKTKEFKATRFEDMPGVRLTLAATPDKPDDTARNWHDRVWNLFPAEVMGKGEVPDSGAPVQAIKIEYFQKGRSLGFLELARNPQPAKNESSAAAQPAKPTIVFARSEFTSGWFKMAADAANLVSEGETLITR